MKKILVCGGGGFIGSHLIKELKKRGGSWVIGVDLKYPEFSKTEADEFIIGDLRNGVVCEKIFNTDYDEVYQLAAEMGGAGYVFTGKNDADIMSASAQINLNVLTYGMKAKIKKIFFSSSACVYPIYNQADPDNPKCDEDSVYPAFPESEYGWEKIFSERLYTAFHRNYGLDIRIARFHNIFGTEGTWDGGREKAPAAICRKVAEAEDGGTIEIWGDGEQTRSFLFVNECIEGILKLMNQSDFLGPVNIGSEEMVSINQLTEMIIGLSGKKIKINHINGPLGVKGRNSDNKLIREKLDWEPKIKLIDGLKILYPWIEKQVFEKKHS
jgi:nucleoside-diphosphate-sugar epimerase